MKLLPIYLGRMSSPNKSPKQPVIYPKWWLYSLYTLYIQLYSPYNRGRMSSPINGLNNHLGLLQPGALVFRCPPTGGGLRLGILDNSMTLESFQLGRVQWVKMFFLFEKRGILKATHQNATGSSRSAKHLYRSIWVRCFWVEMFFVLIRCVAKMYFYVHSFAQETHDICFCLHIRIKSKEEVHGLTIRIKSKEEVHGLTKICRISLAFWLVFDKHYQSIDHIDHLRTSMMLLSTWKSWRISHMPVFAQIKCHSQKKTKRSLSSDGPNPISWATNLAIELPTAIVNLTAALTYPPQT